MSAINTWICWMLRSGLNQQADIVNLPSRECSKQKALSLVINTLAKSEITQFLIASAKINTDGQVTQYMLVLGIPRVHAQDGLHRREEDQDHGAATHQQTFSSAIRHCKTLVIRNASHDLILLF